MEVVFEKRKPHNMLPKDWREFKLGELGGFRKGRNIPKSSLTSEGFQCILYGEIYTKYHFITSTLESKTDYETASQSEKICHGDILFAGSGETAEEIGKCVAYLGKDEAYAGGDIVIFRSEHVVPEFLGYLLNSSPLIEQKSKLGQGSSVIHIYARNLKNLTIPVPPLHEQKAIATALSDVDALIQKLDELIEKKQNIKEGLMQLLLTKRDESNIVKLGKYSEMSSGGTPSSKVDDYYDGNIVWISISDITTSGKYIDSSSKRITQKGLENSSARMFPAGTVFLAMYASIGKCCIITKEASTSQAILGINPNDQLSNEYLYYFLLHNRRAIANQGQQGTQSNLNKGMVQDLDIILPSTQDQLKIVDVLSSMDNEIQLLETKRNKYTQIKKGMMQELLTGKIRIK